jgi:hypothetical protein
MNLQEQIRRIIREEDFIPLESLNIVIKDYEDGFDVLIMNEDKQIGEISFAKESLPNVYTIVDATIDDEYKGNRIYPKTIINLFKERPNIIINSVFRSPEAEKSWRHLLSNLPSNIGKSVKHYKEEDTTLYQLKLKNIQEHIRRVLQEETNYLRMLLRRLPKETLDKIEKEFDSSLNYVSKIFIKKYKSDPNRLLEHQFAKLVIIDFINMMSVRHYLPDDIEWKDDLTNELIEKYKDRIKSMYRVLKK